MTDEEYRRKVAFWSWWGMMTCYAGIVVVVVAMVAVLIWG
jgi:hypothetical protein